MLHRERKVNYNAILRGKAQVEYHKIVAIHFPLPCTKCVSFCLSIK